MRYYLENQVPQIFTKLIDQINQIEFEFNQEVVRDQTIIISLDHAEEFLKNRYSLAAQNSFGITQSIIIDRERFHLIIINENLLSPNQYGNFP